MNERPIGEHASDEKNSRQMPGRILGLSGSAPHSRVRIAASFDVGGAVFWKDLAVLRQFGHDLVVPVTAFTVTGKLVAVDRAKIDVYRTDRDRLALQHEQDNTSKPIAVMPVRRSEFAILDSGGTMSVYRVSE